MLRLMAAALSLSLVMLSTQALGATEELRHGADELTYPDAAAGDDFAPGATFDVQGLVPLAVTGTLAIVEPALQAIASASRVRGARSLDQTARVHLPRLFEFGETTGISYPVAPSFRIGVGYRFATVENLHFEAAETGSLAPDYENHSFLVHARWQF